MNSRNHPLENDYGHNDPWGPILLLDKNIAADPTNSKVYAWFPSKWGEQQVPKNALTVKQSL